MSILCLGEVMIQPRWKIAHYFFGKNTALHSIRTSAIYDNFINGNITAHVADYQSENDLLLE